MFVVLNKSKINSYLISLGTVIFLFAMAFIITDKQTMQTVASSKELPIYCVETKEKKVAFTMNCAWEANDIDSILQTLAKHNTHITFFIVGDFARKYPEAVQKIANAGHEIGNHSNTHPHVNNLTLEKNIEQIEQCSKQIEQITGKKTNLYRGPYGEYNDTVIKAAKSQNHNAIQWNLDTIDYTGITGEEMWERLENKIQEGSIILSHSGTKHTADSLDMLLSKIEQKGFQVVTVSNLILKENYYIDVNGMQRTQNNN